MFINMSTVLEEDLKGKTRPLLFSGSECSICWFPGKNNCPFEQRLQIEYMLTLRLCSVSQAKKKVLSAHVTF